MHVYVHVQSNVYAYIRVGASYSIFFFIYVLCNSYVNVYKNIRRCKHVRVYVGMYVCMYACKYGFCTGVYSLKYAYMHLNMCICTNVRMYTYVYS